MDSCFSQAFKQKAQELICFNQEQSISLQLKRKLNGYSNLETYLKFH